MIHRATTAVLAAILVLASTAASADSDLCDDRASERVRLVGERGGDRCLLLGGGVLGGESEFGSEDLSSGFPVLHLTYGQFYIDTSELGYYLLGGEGEGGYWGLAALLEVPADGFQVEDEPHLIDLDDRDPTLEGGVKLVAGGSWGSAEIGARADLQGKHDGYGVQASYEFPVRLDTLTFSPGVFATYRDADNGDYYYGVDADEVGVDRPAFEVDGSTLGTGIGYSLTYRLGADWSLFHSLQIRVLDGLLDDSPLTVTGEPGAFSAGLLYRAW